MTRYKKFGAGYAHYAHIVKKEVEKIQCCGAPTSCDEVALPDKLEDGGYACKEHTFTCKSCCSSLMAVNKWDYEEHLCCGCAEDRGYTVQPLC